MTPDMAFECLLVSRDPQVICPLNWVLDDFSISTKLCFTSSKVLNELKAGSSDLVVIDEQDLFAPELLDQLRRSHASRKQTVVAVSADERRIPGVDFVLEKPITRESGKKMFRLIYSRMLRDHRRVARYAVMAPVTATDSQKRVIPITVTNIGDGGIGITTSERIDVGEALSFRAFLPNTKRDIRIEARVIWTREYGAAGCEFIRIPPVDLEILHDWLKSKCRVKKPRLEQ
jgi:hypothetical protein